ncbi:molybdate ABC transporter substrate-binding protein [Ahrensia sp. R2A130]|uniref:molybdate ABC transporter substrate-binding protein n=1 Tax=Ahrensia sp. R2A130 TaxID=744979 RepID=UPI0001E09C73|nr:molybdate ABC transporter substrate-binding protein [Ahrensia sp. R2A130]EFL88606.1 molybdate ABC transporter, periplasmic molybdate-binding protein [Ahrensia sp. R2A130]
MLRFALVLLASLIASPFTGPAQAERINVFAAASLRNLLEEVAKGFTEKTGHEVVFTPASSGTLARQISQGAPADVFLSANTDWMDWIVDDGAVARADVMDIASNTLVLVSADKGEDVAIADGTDMLNLIGDGRIAVGLIDSVPAGLYAADALKTLGALEALRPRLAQADNVRAALVLVARGEAEWGIVYNSDAAAEPRVTVRGRIDPALHKPILYLAAPVKESSKQQTAHAFVAYLAASSAIFAAYGFTPIPPAN